MKPKSITDELIKVIQKEMNINKIVARKILAEAAKQFVLNLSNMKYGFPQADQTSDTVSRPENAT